MASLSAQHIRRVLAKKSGLNEDDFTHLYENHLDRVFNYVRYRLGLEEAEDVTADIFVRTWARRQGYDARKGTPTTWLWAIARNTVTDRLRQQGRRPAQVELLPTLAGPSDPPAEVDKDEELRQLRSALLQLPLVDQDIIALRFGAGHTNREISTLTGLTEANVAQRLRRALHKMRTYLQVLIR